MAKLNNGIDRAEWLQCLAAAATLMASTPSGARAEPKDVAEAADELYHELRKRAE